MKRLRTVVWMLLLALFGALVTAGPALAGAVRPAAPSPGATADPSTNLIDLQIVRLTWHDFPPNGSVSFAECIPAPKKVQTDCLVKNEPFGGTSATSDASGGGTVPIQVHEGTFGSFTCDNTNACVILLLAQGWKLNKAVLVPVVFAPPPLPCPPTSGEGSIQAQGSPAAFRAMSIWTGAACNLSPSLSVNYTTSGSDDFTAGNAFAGGSTDFAATAFPLSSGNQKKLATANRSFKYAPLTTSGLVIAYNIFDITTTQQVTNLKLPASVLAEIFTENVFSWTCPPPPANCQDNGGDPAIQALNPDVHFPANVAASVLAGSQGATLEFTQWMTAVAPSIYTMGPQQIWGNTHIDPGGSVKPVTDPFEEGLAVAAPSSANFVQYGYIGVMDSSVAALYGLPTVQIQVNGSDSQFVAATPETVAAAIAAAKVRGGTIAPNYKTTDPGQYPMPTVTYATVPTSFFSTTAPVVNKFGPKDGVVLKSFLAYAISETGQGSLPIGSWPLSDKLKTQTANVTKAIPTKAPPKDNGGGNGNSNGTGGGTSPPPPVSPTPPSPPPPSPSPSPIQYITAGNSITSPKSSLLVPLLAVLAVLGLIAGPALLVAEKVPHAVASTARGLRSVRIPRRRRPDASPPTTDA